MTAKITLGVIGFFALLKGKAETMAAFDLSELVEQSM
jgi:hypothetical protein